MSEERRICYALDLAKDPALIKAYEAYHKPGNVWPEIIESIRAAGILGMEIFRVQNRLFMIMTVSDDFNRENKARLDGQNPKVHEWETLMATFQVPLPGSAESEKWVEMTRIFDLNEEMVQPEFD